MFLPSLALRVSVAISLMEHGSICLMQNDEEPENMVKQDREGNRVKRSRNAEVHNLSEKVRKTFRIW